jgi:hypothetical protein
VAFAEVTSFVRLWVQSSGDGALPDLLVKLRTAEGADAVDKAMVEVTGASLADWNVRWLSWLKSAPRSLPPDVSLGSANPHQAQVARNLRLGELLRARGHNESAATVLGPAQKLAPFDPVLRHRLASALFALGDPAHKEQAEQLVAKIDQVHAEYAPWMALHARSLAERAAAPSGGASQGGASQGGASQGGASQGGVSAEESARQAFQVGVWLSPLTPEVACQEKLPPELPDSETLGALCQAARSAPQD